MVVAGEYGNTSPGLPVPDPDGLVIGARHNPRVLIVELSKGFTNQRAKVVKIENART
jgi:hypothetical protein